MHVLPKEMHEARGGRGAMLSNDQGMRQLANSSNPSWLEILFEERQESVKECELILFKNSDRSRVVSA
jgi:hypothetical protein